jgi:hypothetical protein
MAPWFASLPPSFSAGRFPSPGLQLVSPARGPLVLLEVGRGLLGWCSVVLASPRSVPCSSSGVPGFAVVGRCALRRFRSFVLLVVGCAAV